MFHPSIKMRWLLALVAVLISIPLAACSPASSYLAEPDPLNRPPLPAGDPLNPSTTGGLTYSLDPALANNAVVEKMPAIAGMSETPWWLPTSEYRLMTLVGYPVKKHALSPQIFVYPVDELKSANPNAVKEIERLQALLQSAQGTQDVPLLPLINAVNAMRARVQVLDFQNGHGVRYLTQLNQGVTPINNRELVYTYQGLTHDGKYYIAAILPLNHPSLPADDQVTEQEFQEIAAAYPGYIAELSSALSSEPTASFTPDLAKLDALISSFEIQ